MRLAGFLSLASLTSMLVTDCAPRAPFNLGAPVSPDCPSALESRYVPPGSITDSHHDFDADLILRSRYARILAAMNEPSLSCGRSTDEEAYRFLWLRTWNNPVSIRIFRAGPRYGLEAVQLDGAEGNEAGRILRRVTLTLSRTQWQRFSLALDETHFWQITTAVDDTLGNDGAQWIIEGRREGRYHFVDRWGGFDRVDVVQPLGDLLLEFSELRTQPIR